MYRGSCWKYEVAAATYRIGITETLWAIDLYLDVLLIEHRALYCRDSILRLEQQSKDDCMGKDETFNTSFVREVQKDNIARAQVHKVKSHSKPSRISERRYINKTEPFCH